MPEGTDSSNPNLIPIGYVRRAHGIRGDVLVRGLVSDASARFVEGSSLTPDGADSGSLSVRSVRPKGDDFIVTLTGVSDRNAAEALIGVQFVVPSDERRDLAEGEWWAEDVVGCTVIDSDGNEVGTVADVVTGSAQDRLVVDGRRGKVFEVPFVDDLVPEVDIAKRTIVVSLPDGLVDSDDA